MKHPACLPAMVCTMLFFLAATAQGQTAAEIEMLLDTEEITCFQAAYFVLAAAPDGPLQNPGAAFDIAMENGWLPKKSESSGAITLAGLSLLIMKAFNLKGGFIYRAAPSGRYAYREMISRGFIEGRSYSTFMVSGEQFLRILETVLASGEIE